MHHNEIMNKFKERARNNLKCIALPEGTEPRTVQAAAIITKEHLAKVILIGNRDTVNEIAKKNSVNLSGIEIVDPKNSPQMQKFADSFYELRKHKGVSPEQAMRAIQDPVYFGTMMVHHGEAHGFVSGAEHSTADTIRPALQVIKTAPGINIVSSVFLMVVPNCKYGENGLFFFADCAVNPNPNAQEMAEIAIATADTAKRLCNVVPRVAMLSFSTKGSAEHELVEKVKKATMIVHEIAPDLAVDGEFQVDAAIVPEVGKKKAPNSKVAGTANVLIFPDLQSGNAGYKLVERLANAAAIGPFLQGLNKPVNDLSRGCSVEDIVNVVTITAVQAEGVK